MQTKKSRALERLPWYQWPRPGISQASVAASTGSLSGASAASDSAPETDLTPPTGPGVIWDAVFRPPDPIYRAASRTNRRGESNYSVILVISPGHARPRRTGQGPLVVYSSAAVGSLGMRRVRAQSPRAPAGPF